MRGARVRWLLLACLLLVAGSGPQLAEGEDESPRETYARTPDALVPYGKTADPYRHFYVSPPLHRGPGREDPEPAGLESVRIGVLAPLEESADVDYGISLLRGVQLALGEANAAGGYRDRMPFELVAKNDQQLWGASSDTLIELAYVDRVWVMIGSIDSNSTHVALRAALKAELPIVNVGSTDPTMLPPGHADLRAARIPARRRRPVQRPLRPFRGQGVPRRGAAPGPAPAAGASGPAGSAGARPDPRAAGRFPTGSRGAVGPRT
jgi:hypothetical protein